VCDPSGGGHNAKEGKSTRQLYVLEHKGVAPLVRTDLCSG